MKKSIAVLAAIGLAATMAVTLAGPAAAKGSPKPGAPKPPPKESKCSSKSQKGIQYAMDGFLTANGGAAKVAYVQNGAPLASIIDATYAAASQAHLIPAGQETVTLNLTSQCTGKATATFKYGLQYKDLTTSTTSGNALVQQAGGAVLVKGHWLLTPVTVCDLSSLLGMALPGSMYGTQCYQAAGLPVPTS